MRSSWNTPDRIFTVSGSWGWVTNLDWPGRRFSIQGWMSASVSGMLGGQPSTTQPIAGPWLSPQVVTRNRWPKVLCDMEYGLGRHPVRRPDTGEADQQVFRRRGGVFRRGQGHEQVPLRP